MTSVQRSQTASPRSTKKNLKIFHFWFVETSWLRHVSRIAFFIFSLWPLFFLPRKGVEFLLPCQSHCNWFVFKLQFFFALWFLWPDCTSWKKKDFRFRKKRLLTDWNKLPPLVLIEFLENPPLTRSRGERLSLKHIYNKFYCSRLIALCSPKRPIKNHFSFRLSNINQNQMLHQWNELRAFLFTFEMDFFHISDLKPTTWTNGFKHEKNDVNFWQITNNLSFFSTLHPIFNLRIYFNDLQR